MGEPKHAAHFGGKLAPSILCLTNEEPDLYDAFGIGRGNPLRLISPDALKAGARAASKGFTQGKATGDAMRLTATLVVDEDGIVRYAHYGKHAGDHADINEVLASWQKQTVRSGA